MLNCDEALELISARLDGLCTPEDKVRLEEHLSLCPACRALADDFAQLHAQLPQLAVQPPAGLKNAVMDKVRDAKVASFPVGGKRRWRRQAASVAAVLVLAALGAGVLHNWTDPAQNSAQPLPAAANDTITSFAATDSRAREDSAAEQGPEEDSVQITRIVPESTEKGYGLTEEDALLSLARWLGWAEGTWTADADGRLTYLGEGDAVSTLTCIGLSEDGAAWLCQLEVQYTSNPEGTASCSTYAVALDGGEIYS